MSNISNDIQSVENLKPIMFVGTASDVGKSIITTGFCRIFKQDGYLPAPFKAQNMSLNSFVTPDGLEIGRAQAVQAEAAGVECHTDMNPVLLKPTTDKSSQVVLLGKAVGNMSAKDYFKPAGREQLFSEVKNAFHRLAGKYNPVVMEGAGSISELNLKSRDITNMRMAKEAGAATYLVTDIERGGIFASLYGTIALLDDEERQLIKGIIINKFRGDISLFDEGKKKIEELCGVPVIGILPYFKDIIIEEEDSVALKQKMTSPVNGKVNIAVILLNRLSNFTDFNRLENDSRVNLFYSNNADEISKADIIILPGTKNTIEDTIAIRNSGVAEAIQNAHRLGKTIIGICGGYQMLGQSIADPYHIESTISKTAGLGLLPVNTILQAEKTTRQSSFKFQHLEDECIGYEIHMGETVAAEASPLNFLSDGQTDGYLLNERCWGTYMHGILDNEIVINYLLTPYTNIQQEIINYTEFKDQQYDKLAALFREHIDMNYVYQSLKY
ncbi:cobyric acid synthase [Mucilaginibacter aquaedulcis]|uniref:cobyric acid synthase n=1 Tax=Mucilaginibacter aquaedulcis TaxID=1187081 RepID=UPI0025B568E8|nr:cobyric acid synthase [Mucilaginibacter aquaedulcis]MDN3548222.1 cobyric acid synthase [Mucilaginibacter aquaedulcis]